MTEDKLILSKHPTNNEIVKYQNELNQVSMRRFNATDMDIFFSVVSRVRDKEDHQVVLSYSYLKKLAKYNKHNDFTNYLKKLTHKLQTLTVESDDGEVYRSIVLFTEFEANRKTQTLTVSVNPTFTNYFNQLQNEFTRFSLNQYTNFSSSYSKTAFRLIKQFRIIGRRQFTIEQFRRLMDIPKSYRISDIDRRVIKMIKEEVTPVVPGLEISKVKTNGKRGKKVSGYRFTWKPESAKRDDFSSNPAMEELKAIANLNHNQSLTDEERYRAIDRIKGLELGTTKRQKQFEALSIREIDAEEVDEKSDKPESEMDRLEKFGSSQLTKIINELEKKKLKSELSDDEEMTRANCIIILRRREQQP